MTEHMKLESQVCSTALTILHFYIKKYPFTEFDRYMLCAICILIAGKIEYKKITYDEVMRFYYAHRKGPKGRVRPYDDIKDKLKEDFIDLEFKVQTTIQFEYEFDSPFHFIAKFR